jgi:Activator of Hsp90 ATPase homolog 1-like protein
MEMKKTNFLFLLLFLSLYSAGQSVKNTSYKNESGEKVLRLETILPMGISAVWQLFTTDEMLKTWLAPVAHIELKTGGYILTNYDSTKTLTDKSSINSTIINFLTNEMLTLKINLNNNFPRSVIDADGNLQHIIQLFKIDSKHTKIVSSMVGFGEGPDWDKTYDFFLKGNDWTFKELVSHYH